MKKTFILILGIIFIISPNIFAKGYIFDANTIKWGAGPADPLSPGNKQWTSYNDWTWIEGTLRLDSAYPDDPDYFPYSEWSTSFNTALMGLQITGPTQIVGSTVASTGYQFDLASAGITGKLISKITIVNASWNFPDGVNLPVAPTFYDEDNNRVFRGNPSIGWWQDVEIDFANFPTKKVKFVLDPYAATWIWAGNSMYLEQVTITLINQSEAKCGTKYNPYPSGSDINHDCKIDFSDIALLAQYWLTCNDPANSSCAH